VQRVFRTTGTLLIRSAGRVEFRRRSPNSRGVWWTAGRENAGDGSEILGWNAQDGSPRCGLAPQRKSASRSFRCRVAAGACERHAAVNIRSEFEKCKPRRTVVLTKPGHSPARRRSQARAGEKGLTRASEGVLRVRTLRTEPSGNGWLYWGYCARRGWTQEWRRR
jgi:hypothetical protein